jgi:hypothetical protein
MADLEPDRASRTAPQKRGSGAGFGRLCSPAPARPSERRCRLSGRLARLSCDALLPLEAAECECCRRVRQEQRPRRATRSVPRLLHRSRLAQCGRECASPVMQASGAGGLRRSRGPRPSHMCGDARSCGLRPALALASRRTIAEVRRHVSSANQLTARRLQGAAWAGEARGGAVQGDAWASARECRLPIRS